MSSLTQQLNEMALTRGVGKFKVEPTDDATPKRDFVANVIFPNSITMLLDSAHVSIIFSVDPSVLPRRERSFTERLQAKLTEVGITPENLRARVADIRANVVETAGAAAVAAQAAVGAELGEHAPAIAG